MILVGLLFFVEFFPEYIWAQLCWVQEERAREREFITFIALSPNDIPFEQIGDNGCVCVCVGI